MAYIEYNLKQDEQIIENINYTISDSTNNYTFLQFQKQNASHPSTSSYPSSRKYPVSQGTELKLIATQTYSSKKFYFNYNNQFILFETDIHKNNILTFDGTTLTKETILENVKRLNLIDNFSLSKSSQNVEFSNLKVDFTDGIKEELPFVLQEIKIFDGIIENAETNKLLYTGFVDDYKLPEIKSFTERVFIELAVLSPMSLATKRYISLSGNYETVELINLLFEPLINDGFVLEKVDIDSKNIQVNYFVQTIESIANDLSNKLNFFWYIDENKKIYVINIEKMFNNYPNFEITEKEKIFGLQSITPTLQSNGYFNTINIKNARVYCTGVSRSTPMIYPTNYFSILNNLTLNTDDEITFNSPIDMSITGLETLCSEQQTGNPSLIVLSLTGQNISYNIGYYKGQGVLELPNGIVFDDEDTDGATIILKRDSMFKNLVTGFTWKGSRVSLTEIWSDCMLKYQVFKMMNSTEIEKCKGIISNSGVIENTIDVNEKWFTKRELIEYCRNMMSSNSNQITDVQLKIKNVDYDLKIGDLIRINMPKFMINDNFIITSIKSNYSLNSKDFTIDTKNSKLTDSYIDLFRSTETQEDDEKYDISNIIEYSDEGIIESYEVVE